MKTRKVMILTEGHEEIASEALELLKKENYELVIPNNGNAMEEEKELQECEAILVRGATINKEMIDSFPNLKIIARSGVGTDNIDIHAASEKGAAVTNVPDANFTSVAEHVIGLVIALSRQIVKSDKALRQGHFNARHTYMGSELHGKTIGIVGIGRIGQLVAKKCMYGLDMKVITFDPYANRSEIDENIQFVDSVEDIYSKSDFISLHLPYIPKLHHFINEESFKKMKSSTYFINCARGRLVDEAALVKAIQNGEIAGAGIDVFEDEPPKEDNALWPLENVIVTPHMGASTKESLTLMSIGAAKEIVNVLSGKEPKNAMNTFHKTS